MKKTITMAVDFKQISTKEVEIDFPEEAKFFYKNDDGNFFPEGDTIFAIIPRYKNNLTESYMLYKISGGKMTSTDFVPTKDMISEYWLKEGIRKLAFNLIKPPYSNWEGWSEIEKEEFINRKNSLLEFQLQAE